MSRTATIRRAIRVPASAFAIVLLVALAIPPALSSRYRLAYNERAPAPLAQVDPLTVDEIVDAARRAGGRTVYWIGDSVVWSGNETGTTTAPQLLEAELRRVYGSDVHVINAALPASRTADKYGILLKILEAAPALVIYESKYLEFSRAQVETIIFRYPYLNGIVATDPAYAARYQEFFRSQPPLLSPRSRADVVAETTAERLLSFVRYRAVLQQIVLGGDLYGRLSDEPLPDPLPSLESETSGAGSGTSGAGNATAASAQQRATELARRPESFTGAYHSGPFDAFANAGLFFGARVVGTLDHAGVPSIAYVAAINHQLIGSLGTEPLFFSNMALVDGLFSGHKFAYANYNAALPEDALFRDTEHLTDAGNAAMARLLLTDHRAVFERALGGGR